jgi:hypothetical protein
MNNCYVKTYKVAVNNNDLVILNSVAVKVLTSGSSYEASGGNIKVLGGTVNIYNSSNVLVAEDVTEYYLNDTYKIVAGNDNILVNHLDKTGTNKYLGNSTGDVIWLLDTFNNSKWYTIKNSSNDVKCVGRLDLSTLALSPSGNSRELWFRQPQQGSKIIIPTSFYTPASLYRFYVGSNVNASSYRNVVEGNIMSFKNSINLSEVSLQYNQGLVGNLNDLFDALRTSGKTSGVIAFWLQGTNCTLTVNGVTKTLTTTDAAANGSGVFVKFTQDGYVFEQANSNPY